MTSPFSIWGKKPKLQPRIRFFQDREGAEVIQSSRALSSENCNVWICLICNSQVITDPICEQPLPGAIFSFITTKLTMTKGCASTFVPLLSVSVVSDDVLSP